MKNPSTPQRIFGIRAILEALAAGQSIDKVFVQKNAQGGLMQELMRALKKNAVAFSYVPVEKLNRLAAGNHQGAVAQVSPVRFVALETLVTSVLEKDEAPFFILLDQVNDARNFGAIIRTAACVGAHGIIVQKSGSAPVNADTIKTSAGAVFQIPICKVDHIKDAVFYLQASGIAVLAATEKTETTLYEHRLDDPLAVLVGSEEKGISPALLKMADLRAKLPMPGGVASLNVSVACGAVLYEVVRQRIAANSPTLGEL